MGMSEDHSPLEAGCSCENYGGCLGSSGAAAALLRIAGSGEAQRPRWTLFERAMFSFCCKLDRLARSVPHLCEIGACLEAKGVALKVLDQAIDTSTPTGMLMFNLLGATRILFCGASCGAD